MYVFYIDKKTGRLNIIKVYDIRMKSEKEEILKKKKKKRKDEIKVWR